MKTKPASILFLSTSHSLTLFHSENPQPKAKDDEKNKKMKAEETNQETSMIQIQTKRIESKKIKSENIEYLHPYLTP